MKRNVRRVIAVIFGVLLAVGVLLRINSYSLSLLMGGVRQTTLIEEGFSYQGTAPNWDTQRWRVILADKDGESRLFCVTQGLLGFWGLPQHADTNRDGLEFWLETTVPASGGFYGYNPYGFSDPATETEDEAYAFQSIFKADWFYHGSNAVKTLEVPESALPKDCTVHIYQFGPEYVLHLTLYQKGSGAFDGGFESIYQALLEGGCVE